MLIVAGVAALSQLGVQTASLLAALGAAGLAIGLALQGTLANIAAGIMLLWLRPFRVGDYIEIVGVDAVRRNGEGDRALRLPARDLRRPFPLRAEFRDLGVPAAQPLPQPPGGSSASMSAFAPERRPRPRANDPAQDDQRDEAGVLREPPPDVFVSTLSAGAPVATCRFWAAREGIGAVQRAMLEAARRALEAADLPPTQLVRTIPGRRRSLAPLLEALSALSRRRIAWRSSPD